MGKENINYEISEAGRVKSAGVPVDLVFDASEPFRQNPSPNTASQVFNSFAELRQSPPDEIRDRFFPRNRATKSMFRSGSLLLRPILKTDQGSGQFLPFEFSNEENSGVIHYQIETQEGSFIEEVFFENELAQKGITPKILEALYNLSDKFKELNIHESQLAYERFQIQCDEMKITHQRDVEVGRDALFFIRPSKAVSPIEVSSSVKQEIKKHVNNLTESFEDLIQREKFHFSQRYDLKDYDQRIKPNLPLYFQTDCQIFPNGSILIDQIQLPDVGLFLLKINSSSQVLDDVKSRVQKISGDVFSSLFNKAKSLNVDCVNLITRDEVLQNQEDTLEILEIQAISENLLQRGIKSKVISISQVELMNPKSLNLLLNINTNSESYLKLLSKYLKGELKNIFPDPFLLKVQDQLTEYKSFLLKNEDIKNLSASASEIENKSPEKIFVQLMALDNLLNKIGVYEDVFHLYTSSQRTPIPCFRYDLKGIQIALNYIKPGDVVTIRSVPLSPERSVLFDKDDRPLYSVFRTMFTEK